MVRYIGGFDRSGNPVPYTASTVVEPNIYHPRKPPLPVASATPTSAMPSDVPPPDTGHAVMARLNAINGVRNVLDANGSRNSGYKDSVPGEPDVEVRISHSFETRDVIIVARMPSQWSISITVSDYEITNASDPIMLGVYYVEKAIRQARDQWRSNNGMHTDRTVAIHNRDGSFVHRSATAPDIVVTLESGRSTVMTLITAVMTLGDDHVPFITQATWYDNTFAPSLDEVVQKTIGVVTALWDEGLRNPVTVHMREVKRHKARTVTNRG